MVIFLLTRLFSWSWDLCLAGVTLCLHGVLVRSVLSPHAGGSLDSLCSPPLPSCPLMLACLLLCLPVSLLEEPHLLEGAVTPQDPVLPWRLACVSYK